MQLDVVKGLEPGVRQAVEHLAVIKYEQPLKPLNIYLYNKLLILSPVSILVVSIPADQGHIP